jgi:hypothetical protein
VRLSGRDNVEGYFYRLKRSGNARGPKLAASKALAATPGKGQLRQMANVLARTVDDRESKAN